MKLSKTTVIIIPAALFVAALSYYFWSERGSWSENTKTTGIYELDLRSAVGRDRQTGILDVKQWRMDIPQYYIKSSYGINAKPEFNSSINKKKPFGMNLEAWLDPKDLTIQPMSKNLTVRQSQRKQHIRILITDSGPIMPLIEKGNCLTQDQVNAHVLSKNYLNNCPEHMTLCPVNMHIEGWGVRLSIPKQYYDAPAPVCHATKVFLDEMTIRRDRKFQ